MADSQLSANAALTAHETDRGKDALPLSPRLRSSDSRESQPAHLVDSLDNSRSCRMLDVLGRRREEEQEQHGIPSQTRL